MTMSTKLISMPVEQFESLLASNSPAPGGGSVAALQGALGAALVRMVAALTIDKPLYAEHQELLNGVLSSVEGFSRELMRLVDLDTLAFNGVTDALALPKDTEAQKAVRSEAMQNALKACTETPYRVMEITFEMLCLMRQMKGKYNMTAASDFGVAAISLKAAVQGAWLNVLINTGGINDTTFVREHLDGATALLSRTLTLADEIYLSVTQSLASRQGA